MSDKRTSDTKTAAPTVVLHLSDIHRTPDEKATNAELLLSLTNDFDRYQKERIPAPHVVVVSGDLVQSAQREEYEEAREFIEGVLEHWTLARDRIVLVPGNHDVHWPTYRRSVHPVEREDVAVSEDLVRHRHDVILAPVSEDAYAQRLENFRYFHHSLTGREFPQDRHRSFVIHELSDLPVPLCVAALSSVDTNDQYHAGGRISPSAILAAKKARTHEYSIDLAVWHHDADWNMTTTEDFLQLESVQFLAQADFHLGLCGHTHRPGKHDMVQHRDQRFPMINAGTLCSGARQRAESIPRSYNIIEIHSDGRVRVHVRVKDTLSDPWRDHAIFGEPGARTSWYEFRIGSGRGEDEDGGSGSDSGAGGGATANRELRTGPPSSPFKEYDARAQTLTQAVRQYVWLETSSLTDSDQAQVIVGTRGSGKTSLLTTLTPLGRLHHAERLASSPLRRLAFLFPLRIHQISGLSGRGWIPVDERADLFRAILGAGMAYAFVDAVVDAVRLFDETPGMPTLAAACNTIGRCWFPRESRTWDASELRGRITAINNDAVRLHSDRNDERRRDGVTALAEQEICASSIQFIIRAAEDLAEYDALSETHWVAAFDEAEFLSERQQSLLYAMLGQTTARVGVKIATLPYAHSTAIQNLERPLVPGDDYEEVAIALSYARTSASARASKSADEKDEVEAQAFAAIADQIWQRRLAPHFETVPPLSEIFPNVPYEDVVSELRGAKTTAEDLQLELIGELSPKRQRTAESKTGEQLGSQFLRKYQQPFRFRTARRDGRRLKKEVPLYWGLSDIVRACDGNCRSFLQILEICWRQYWATDGLRPLTVHEQHGVLTAWAASVRRKVRAFGERGAELDRILENLTDAFQSKLHSGYLTYETFRWAPRHTLTDSQLEAILIGIAYGLLSPRLDRGNEHRVAYPAGDQIAVRLGFPVAVSASLPLRGGAELSVDLSRMIQLGFPGWE